VAESALIVPIEPGTRLGFYEILAPLGQGGMGEVYRARDTQLKRDVAIKVLPDAFAQDPERLGRFQREAELLATLNHPNIAAVYGVERTNGVNAIVLELVEGETLADRLSRGAIPLTDTMTIARQIVEAMEAAHEKGIVHRDLKPANVKVTPDDRVKVLDFGLAKLADPAGAGLQAGPNVSQSPTITTPAMTLAGMILGTAAYMSPEQAKGRPADRRSDVWAFGCVLYEMLTGTRAFPGDDVTETLAAVIKTEPDWSRLPAETPAPIRRLLARCLVKDAKLRIADVSTARIEIDDARLEGPSQIPAGDPGVRRSAIVPWSVAAVAIVAAFAVGAAAYLSRRAVDTRVILLSAPFPDKTVLNPGALPAVSPDGRRITFGLAFEGQQGLWVRDLTSTSARLLPGTSGAIFPFWSPDSHSIGFFADGKLKKIDPDGGPAQTLCDAQNGRGGTWNADDVIVFAPTPVSGLWRVSAAGGQRSPITNGESGHRNPSFLPDGHHFLYTIRSSEPDKAGVYIGDLNANTRSRLLPDATNAVYSSLGYLLYVRERTLVAQRFDTSSLTVAGEAMPIAEGVDYFPSEAQAMFSISQARTSNPVLAYTSGWVDEKVQLTWFDRAGRAIGTVGPAGVIVRRPRISPDGHMVAYDKFDAQSGNTDIWVHDLARGADSRFTTNGHTNTFPVWSSDGTAIAFSSDRDRVPRVFRKGLSGVADEMPVDSDTAPMRPADWSRDGQYLVEQVLHAVPTTKGDIWVLPLRGEGKRFPYAKTAFDETEPRLSPDGKWLAYASDESKRLEVYLQTFPAPTQKVLVSTAGGTRPVWSRDGRELFFFQADRTLMSVDVRRSSTLEVSTPKPLFRMTRDAEFDVSADGRFLMPNQTAQAFAPPMTVVINWPSLLKR